MGFKDAFAKLEKSSEYKNWKKKFPKGYLIYGFIMLGEKVKEEWQIGLFDHEKITAFTVADKIIQNPGIYGSIRRFKKRGVRKSSVS